MDITVLLADELVAGLAAAVRYSFSAPLPSEPILLGTESGLSALIVVIKQRYADVVVHRGCFWLPQGH